MYMQSFVRARTIQENVSRSWENVLHFVVDVNRVDKGTNLLKKTV